MTHDRQGSGDAAGPDDTPERRSHRAGRAKRAGRAVGSEWVKFRATRSSVVTAIALALSFPLMALLVAATESLQPDDTVLGASVLGGATLAQLLATALGAALVTSEFRTGLIHSTLLACPRRWTVLAAKATVVGGVVFAVTLPAATAAYAIGRAMLDDRYAPGDPFPALLGIAFAIAVLAVAGVAVGTLVRHTAGAVGAAVAVVLLPGMVAPLLGNAERWVGGASLSGVLQKVSQSSDATPESVGTLGAWPSLAAVAAGTAVVMAIAGRRFHLRDA